LAKGFPPRNEKMFAFPFPTRYLEIRLRTLPAMGASRAAEGDGR
jgi:hypothetical protein